MPTGEPEVDALRVEPSIGACAFVDLPESREMPASTERLLPAFLVSMGVHGLFVILLLSGVLAVETGGRMQRASFRIQLVPAGIPPAGARNEAVPIAPAPAPAVLIGSEPVAVNPGSRSPGLPEPSEPVVRMPVDIPSVSRPSTPAQPVAGPVLRAPSTLAIRQLVETPSADQNSMQDCTSLQRYNPLIRCTETDQERTAARLPGLVATENGPSAITLGIMLRRYDAQRERVRTSGVAVPGYLDYQMGQILEAFSGVPVTPVVSLTDLMNSNNRAYQMIQSVTQPR